MIVSEASPETGVQNTSSSATGLPVRPAGPVARVMLGMIAWYQRAASARVSPCRFFPSCSNYGIEAIEVHGAARGGWLTLRRLLRCRPFGPSGVDLVPAPRSSASTMSERAMDEPGEMPGDHRCSHGRGRPGRM